jgi:hypothetical protein
VNATSPVTGACDCSTTWPQRAVDALLWSRASGRSVGVEGLPWRAEGGCGAGGGNRILQAWVDAHGRKTPARALALKAVAVVRKGKLTRTFNGWLEVAEAEKAERERGFREDFLIREYDEKQRRKREFKATRTYHKKILARVRRCPCTLATCSSQHVSGGESSNVLPGHYCSAFLLVHVVSMRTRTVALLLGLNRMRDDDWCATGPSRQWRGARVRAGSFHCLNTEGRRRFPQGRCWWVSSGVGGAGLQLGGTDGEEA